MVRIANLELHVAHSCNLACESCSHYSNHNHKGLVSLEAARGWIEPWRGRLKPVTFSLLGGEPAINPDLPAFVALARASWPKARIRLATYGLLLARHPDLPRRLAEAGDTMLELSIHHASDAYRARLEPVFDLLRAWIRDHGIRVRLIHSYGRWTRRYRGFGAEMEPFEDGAPRRSWENCPARCPQLFEGRIWKCAPLAYLGMQDRKYGLSEKWRPYLSYAPLGPDRSDAELRRFFALREEPACGMCSSRPQRFALPDPLPLALQRAG
jgi:MoaA/NifB/PqqE/SkfB family radical SAM enzyme